MYMVHGKAEVAKLEPESFKFMERLDADVNVDLPSETSIPVVGDKNHRHPVIAGVTRNLFRATAIYNIHEFFFSCRVSKGAGKSLPRATKNRYGLMGEKR